MQEENKKRYIETEDIENSSDGEHNFSKYIKLQKGEGNPALQSESIVQAHDCLRIHFGESMPHQTNTQIIKKTVFYLFFYNSFKPFAND